MSLHTIMCNSNATMEIIAVHFQRELFENQTDKKKKNLVRAMALIKNEGQSREKVKDKWQPSPSSLTRKRLTFHLTHYICREKKELDDQSCGLRSHLADRKAKRNTQLVVRQQKKKKMRDVLMICNPRAWRRVRGGRRRRRNREMKERRRVSETQPRPILFYFFLFGKYSSGLFFIMGAWRTWERRRGKVRNVCSRMKSRHWRFSCWQTTTDRPPTSAVPRLGCFN